MNLRVPLLHDQPDLGSIELSYEIWSEGATTEPVLFLCGGPGERAIDLRPHLPWTQIAQKRPIVLLNQRGTDLLPKPLEIHPDMFLDRNIALQVLSNQASVTQPAAYTPWQSALDIALLADHLGVEKLDIVAHSYGTHLAMAAMKAIPDRIGRVAMLGFEGPDQTFKFGQPFDLALARFPNGLERLAEIENQLWEVELNGLTLKIGSFGIRWILASWMGLGARMKRLPEFLDQPAEAMPRAISGFIKMLQRRSPVFYLNDAASSASLERWEMLRADPSPWAEAVNFPFPEIGAAYGVDPLTDGFRADPEYNGKVLVLTGEYDAFTPTSNFLQAGGRLTSATHEELPGAYHDTLLLGVESAAILESWL
jgi:pimeloyl-ACP methyl ester carboxylesterase